MRKICKIDFPQKLFIDLFDCVTFAETC